MAECWCGEPATEMREVDPYGRKECFCTECARAFDNREPSDPTDEDCHFLAIQSHLMEMARRLK